MTAPHFPWSVHPDFDGLSSLGKYGDFLKEIDTRTGQILDTIDNGGIENSTLIIFTADNGGAYEPWFERKYDHDMNYGRSGQKRHILEGGLRVPFIAKWQGNIEPGSVADTPISLVDMLATFSSLTNQPYRNEFAEDSYDISGLFLGNKEVKRGPIINQSTSADALSITVDEYKLIPNGIGKTGLRKPGKDDPEGMLFNLTVDSLERENIYEDRPEIVNNLENLLEEYVERGYSTPKKSGY